MPAVQPMQGEETQILICDSQTLLCPACERPLRRIWVEDGITYAWCDQPSKTNTKVPCAQHVTIASEDGVAAVSRLTPEEFRIIKEHARHLLRMRSALRRRLREL